MKNEMEMMKKIKIICQKIQYVLIVMLFIAVCADLYTRHSIINMDNNELGVINIIPHILVIFVTFMILIIGYLGLKIKQKEVDDRIEKLEKKFEQSQR